VEELAGYAAFHFVRGFDGPPGEDNIYLNDIAVDELVYDSPEALIGLLAFFGRQADQAQHLILRSQDQSLYHLFDDPGDRSQNVIPPAYHQSSRVGVGLMYRIIDVGKALAAYQEVRVRPDDHPVEITTYDELIPENTGTYRIGNRSKATPGLERLSADIRELSSLLMGAATVPGLSGLGLVEPTPRHNHPTLDRLFPGNPEPICLSGF
jgi:predicted acetyltransferase